MTARLRFEVPPPVFVCVRACARAPTCNVYLCSTSAKKRRVYILLCFLPPCSVARWISGCCSLHRAAVALHACAFGLWQLGAHFVSLPPVGTRWRKVDEWSFIAAKWIGLRKCARLRSPLGNKKQINVSLIIWFSSFVMVDKCFLSACPLSLLVHPFLPPSFAQGDVACRTRRGRRVDFRTWLGARAGPASCQIPRLFRSVRKAEKKKKRERTALTEEWIQANGDPNAGRLRLTLACSLRLLNWTFYSYHQSPSFVFFACWWVKIRH